MVQEKELTAMHLDSLTGTYPEARTKRWARSARTSIRRQHRGLHRRKVSVMMLVMGCNRVLEMGRVARRAMFTWNRACDIDLGKTPSACWS